MLMSTITLWSRQTINAYVQVHWSLDRAYLFCLGFDNINIDYYGLNKSYANQSFLESVCTRLSKWKYSDSPHHNKLVDISLEIKPIEIHAALGEKKSIVGRCLRMKIDFICRNCLLGWHNGVPEKTARLACPNQLLSNCSTEKRQLRSSARWRRNEFSPSYSHVMWMWASWFYKSRCYLFRLIMQCFEGYAIMHASIWVPPSSQFVTAWQVQQRNERKVSLDGSCFVHIIKLVLRTMDVTEIMLSEIWGTH